MHIARLKLLPFAVVALCAASASSHAATVLYSTDFNGPAYADGAIATDITTGQSGWLYTASATGTAPVISNTATNGVVSLASSGPDVKHALADTVTAGTSVYVSATINLSAVQATGDYFLHLSDGSSSLFFGRIYAKSATGGYTLAFASSSGTPAAAAYGTTVLSLNTSYNILFRYDYVAGTTNDTGSLWVNPTSEDGSTDTAYVGLTVLGVDPTVAINTINLRQGNASNAATLTVDNLSVYTIPEPATALLGAFGLLGLLRRRR